MAQSRVPPHARRTLARSLQVWVRRGLNRPCLLGGCRRAVRRRPHRGRLGADRVWRPLRQRGPRCHHRLLERHRRGSARRLAARQHELAARRSGSSAPRLRRCVPPGTPPTRRFPSHSRGWRVLGQRGHRALAPLSSPQVRKPRLRGGAVSSALPTQVKTRWSRPGLAPSRAGPGARRCALSWGLLMRTSRSPTGEPSPGDGPGPCRRLRFEPSG